MTPSNLTQRARREFGTQLRRSAREFGEEAALRLATKLISKCDEIAAGLNHGHLRADMPDDTPLRFTAVWPLVVVYLPRTRIVVRIIDGRHDIPKLLRR